MKNSAPPNAPVSGDTTPKRGRGAALYSAARVWSQVAAASLFLAAAGILQPAGLGEFLIAASIFAALSVIVGQGVYEYVLKEHDSDTAPVTAFVINMATATVAAIAAVGIAFILPSVLNSNKPSILLCWLAPIFYLDAIVSLMECVILRRGWINRTAIATLLAETTGLVAALAALAIGAGVIALVIQRAVRGATLGFVYLVSYRWRLQFGFSPSEALAIIRFSQAIVSSRGVWLGCNALIDVMIGAFLNLADAGLFRLANRLLNIGNDILFQPFRALLWVELPPLRGDPKAFNAKLMSLVEIYGTGLFAVVWGMALIAGAALPLLLGSQWQAAAPAVMTLALARLIGLPTSPAEAVFPLNNRNHLFVMSSLVSSGAYIAAIYLAAPHGLFWAGFAFACVALFTQFFLLRPMLHSCCGTLAPMLYLMARLTANATIMTLAVWPCILFGPRMGLEGWPLVVAVMLLGAAFYVFSARLFTPEGANAYLDPVLRFSRRLKLTLPSN